MPELEELREFGPGKCHACGEPHHDFGIAPTPDADPITNDPDVMDLWMHVIYAAFGPIVDLHPDTNSPAFLEAYMHLSRNIGWLSGCLVAKGRIAGRSELLAKIASQGPGRYLLEVVDLSKTPRSTRLN